MHRPQPLQISSRMVSFAISLPPCQNKNGLFYEKWHRQLEIQKGILNSLEEQHPRYHEIMHLITMIEGEISGS